MCVSLQNKKIKCQIIWNNLLERFERNIPCLIPRESISVRNKLFMDSLPNILETQDIIKNEIMSCDSFALIRFGLYEYLLCYQFLEIKNGLRKGYSDFLRYHIKMDAGLFNNSDEELNLYANNILENLRFVDIIAYWRNFPNKKIFRCFYKKNIFHINVEYLYPFPFWHKTYLPNWQKVLKGKKILIVSSFTDTIKLQYANRDKLWENYEEILPKFELILFKAVQTNGGFDDERFHSWSEALNYMLKKILSIEFDIALICCGCYGMPLAIELKKRNKKAIQLGGCFQLWFGIRGGRWEKDNSLQLFINDYWVYPSEKETPPLSKEIDNSCYWNPNINKIS